MKACSRSIYFMGFELSALVSLDSEYRQYSQHESKLYRRFAPNGRGLFLLVYVVWSLGGNQESRMSIEWLHAFSYSLKPN